LHEQLSNHKISQILPNRQHNDRNYYCTVLINIDNTVMTGDHRIYRAPLPLTRDAREN